MLFMRVITFKNYFSMKKCYVGVLGCIEKCVGFAYVLFLKLLKYEKCMRE